MRLIWCLSCYRAVHNVALDGLKAETHRRKLPGVGMLGFFGDVIGEICAPERPPVRIYVCLPPVFSFRI